VGAEGSEDTEGIVGRKARSDHWVDLVNIPRFIGGLRFLPLLRKYIISHSISVNWGELSDDAPFRRAAVTFGVSACVLALTGSPLGG
jgi:hypothetical protein